MINIWEAVGIGSVVFFACLGASVVFSAAWLGLQTIKSWVYQGKQHEDKVVGDALARLEDLAR